MLKSDILVSFCQVLNDYEDSTEDTSSRVCTSVSSLIHAWSFCSEMCTSYDTFSHLANDLVTYDGLEIRQANDHFSRATSMNWMNKWKASKIQRSVDISACQYP